MRIKTLSRLLHLTQEIISDFATKLKIQSISVPWNSSRLPVSTFICVWEKSDFWFKSTVLVISVFRKPASMESSLYKACAGRMGWAGLIQVSFSLITTMSGILESHPIKLLCFSAPVELRGCGTSWKLRCWEQKVLRAIILTAKRERLCPVLWYFHDDISVTRWGMIGYKYATTLSYIMRALGN